MGIFSSPQLTSRLFSQKFKKVCEMRVRKRKKGKIVCMSVGSNLNRVREKEKGGYNEEEGRENGKNKGETHGAVSNVCRRTWR